MIASSALALHLASPSWPSNRPTSSARQTEISEIHPRMLDLLARFRARMGQILAGLPTGGERIWPAVDTDLVLAHKSIYAFFKNYVVGKTVLDAGCGTGYGSASLARHGSRSVLGIDVDTYSIRYAQNKFKADNLTFAIGDCEALNLPGNSMDVVVSSNMLEHLVSPGSFLRALRSVLRDGGIALIAVPPITNERLLADNQANPFHKSNLWIDDWIDLFRSHGFGLEMFRHSHHELAALDFGSFRPSRFSVDDFTFPPSSRDELYAKQSLTAIFLLRPEGQAT